MKKPHWVIFVICALGIILSSVGDALAQDPYFIHISDPHVAVLTTTRWEQLLEEILALSPAPDLVLCSGDLVEYGAGVTGALNYEALLNVPSITTVGGDHFLDDEQHQIPIFFSPGNHDYRNSAQLTKDLTNYKAKIHSTEYFHEIVNGTWAIFSVNSGFDTLATWPHSLPEGTGLSSGDLVQLESDLDMLDGVADGNDTSDFKKIIFLHHPHQYPDGESCSLDGRFLEAQSAFIRICEDYGVGWALFGHLHPDSSIVFDLGCNEWSAGSGTKCIIAISAKEKGFRRESIDGTGTDAVLWSTTPTDRSLPSSFTLLQNYPNPFNPVTAIRFDLPRAMHVKLCVYNAKGEFVAEIVDQQMTEGRKEVNWTAKDSGGREVPSGIYFYRLVAGDFVQTRKMVLIR